MRAQSNTICYHAQYIRWHASAHRFSLKIYTLSTYICAYLGSNDDLGSCNDGKEGVESVISGRIIFAT